MKNKKLFAILTLVCFMFTLMPVAAFATADPYVDDQVYVYANPAGPQPAISAATEIEVLTSRTFNAGLGDDTTTLVESGYAFYAVDANNKGVAVTTTGAMTIKLPGEYQVFAVPTAGNNVAQLFDNANDILKDETPATAVAKVQAALDDVIVKAYATVTVSAPELQAVITVTETNNAYPDYAADDKTVGVVADNGFTAAGVAEVKVGLTYGKAVVGKAPTITAPDYVTVTPANPKKVVTDAFGEITYKISANRAGTFEVVFSYADANDVAVKVIATDSNVANVEVVKEAAKAINRTPVGGEFNTGAKLKFTDANGSVISVDSVINADDSLDNSDMIKVTVVSQPATSKLTGASFKLEPSTTVLGTSELVIPGTANLKVGSYKVNVALENGKNVTVAFEVAKMGKAVGIAFNEPDTTIALGATTPSFVVYKYDANGVTSPMIFATDYSISVNGKAWDKANSVVHDDEKYIGSTITVLAKDNTNDFVATTTLEVVDSGMEIAFAKTTAEVGVTTQLKANVLDAKGNKVDVPDLDGTIDIVVLEKPANAYVYATGAVSGKDINVTFLGSVAGEYKIQAIAIDANDTFVTGIETIKVGNNEAAFKDVVVISMGADKMIVNDEVVALDVAPFIENNRTMMQFNVLWVFGIDVKWVPETESVVAEGNGIKVVMNLGSKVAVVNGEEVTLDVAPYSVNGRTVVPVGLITGVLDITPTFTYNADGSIADILFTK